MDLNLISGIAEPCQVHVISNAEVAVSLMLPAAPVSCPQASCASGAPSEMQVTPLLSLVTKATVSQAWAHERAGLEPVFCSIIPRGGLRAPGSIATAKGAGPQTGQRDASISSLLLYH